MTQIAIFLISVALAKTTADFSTGTGSVQFRAIGKPGAIKIQGKGMTPRGKLVLNRSKLNGAITFDLDTLMTGIKLRDEHMKKKYLETDKFPAASLTLTKFELSETAFKTGFKKEGIPFEGTLNLHGISKPVKGTADLARTGNDAQLS